MSTAAQPGRIFYLKNRSLSLGFGAAAIFLLVLGVYWPALRGQFVWDDTLLVDKNPLVTGALNLRSVWFQTDFPLTLVAFWLQWLAWGKSAVGYHAVNLLLHSISALLIWRVLARLKIPGAWLAAVLFAVHPVCVASVAWTSELKNTLSLPFFLLSIWCYLRFDEPESELRTPLSSSDVPGPQSRVARHSWYWLSLIAFLLALLSKTSTVMLPIVLLGCAWWRRGRLTTQDWFRTIPFFLPAMAFGLLSIWFQTHQAFTSGSVQTENFWGRLAGAGWAVWFYLGKAILPLNLNLIYPRWQIDATAPSSYLPAALLVGTFFVCWRFRHSWGRPVLFALAYFAVTLFPALGFFDMYFLAISRVSDHFQYLSLIGVVALAAAALSSWLKPGVVKMIGTAAILALSLLTLERARVLANDETLWRDTLLKNPTAWPAHNNLACILAEQQKYDEAIGHFEAALKSNPRNAPAEANLARALEIQGRLGEAETHFLAAVAIKPNDVESRKSFASLLAKEGKKEEALKQMRAIIRPGSDSQTRLEFAKLLHQTGRGGEAVEQYRQALALRPNSIEALNNFAWLLATCADASVRDGTEAVRLAEQACRLSQFSEAVPMATLAAAYAEAGRFNEAVAHAQKAIALASSASNPQFAAVNRQLLDIYRAGKPWHEPPVKN